MTTIATLADIPPYMQDILNEAVATRERGMALIRLAEQLERQFEHAAEGQHLGECPDWCKVGADHRWRFRPADRVTGPTLSREHEGSNERWGCIWAFEFLRMDGSRDIARPLRMRNAPARTSPATSARK